MRCLSTSCTTSFFYYWIIFLIVLQFISVFADLKYDTETLPHHVSISIHQEQLDLHDKQRAIDRRSLRIQQKYEMSGAGEVVGFWNIYAEGPYYRAIIEEQYRVLQTSGLMQRLTRLYYTTMGEDGWRVKVPSPKAKHLKYFLINGDEIKTLQLLQNYCIRKPRAKVLYFHNKGSLNHDVLNTNLRRALDCFVLNPSCIDALDDFDTCGWRITPLPHIHYSGNYWWARCTHINELIQPIASKSNYTFLSLTSRLYKEDSKWGLPNGKDPFPDQPYLGLGRYFAETWVGSKPWFKPADCMNASVNNRYLWGKYPLPWRMLNKRCPNFNPDFMNASVVDASSSVSSLISDSSMIRGYSSSISSLDGRNDSFKADSGQFKHLHYGLGMCGLAGMIKEPHLMQQRFHISIQNFTPELYDRSMYWYGQRPELHLQWLSLFK